MKVYYFIFISMMSMATYSFAQIEEETTPINEESALIPEGGPESELMDLSSDQQTEEEIEEQEDLFAQEMEGEMDVNDEVITEEMD